MSWKEINAGKLDDFEDNGLKTVEVDGAKVLIARVGDEFHALSAFCTHYGAPLEEGVLSDGRIVCPWHHACFNVKTGDILEPPAMDALVSYEIWKDGENLMVRIPEDPPRRRLPEMSRREPGKDDRKFVIIGGGAAGYSAAQSLRENGFKGSVLMITREMRLPYDRPNLSKDYLHGEAKEEWMPLREDSFYAEHDIEVMEGSEVVSLEMGSGKIVLDDGGTIEPDCILVATGGRARKLGVPGSELRNIFTLRSFDDAEAIISAAGDASKAVVIGASFIGMEAAHSLTELGLNVTVVGKESIPFEHVFGEEIGALFKREHEMHGVVFEMEKNVSRFFGEDSVEKVLLSDGTEIEADLVLVGIGVAPETGFVKGIELSPDGSIPVDGFLRASDKVFAAGDIASYPDWRAGRRARIEHWRVALQQGRIAAMNMLGMEARYAGVPFFWTAQAGLNLRYVGHAQSWDSTITWGSVPDREFITFFVSDGVVLAACGNRRDTEMDAIEELLRLRKMPWPEELASGPIDLRAFL